MPDFKMRVFNSFNELAEANGSVEPSPMSVFNSNVSDMFNETVSPLVVTAKQAGENFKVQKDAVLGQFENKGIKGGAAFKPVYGALRELNAKKCTLKSVTERFPDLSRKDVQELAKVLADNEPTMLSLLHAYQTAYYTALQTAEKQHDIFAKNIPNTDPDLESSYENVTKHLATLDDEVRAGLKI